jgi:hypothetical protein
MDANELAKLSDQELLEVAKNNKPSPLFDAFFIGFLIGILVFSAAKSGWGFTMLVPLFLIYIMLKKPKQHAALKEELEKRNLKIG